MQERDAHERKIVSRIKGVRRSCEKQLKKRIWRENR